VSQMVMAGKFVFDDEELGRRKQITLPNEII
jgi:hypothetical protein